MTDTPVEQFDLTTTKSGSTAICQCTVAPGTYDITAVSEHTLINVKRNVVISTPSTAVDMGTLLEGNANDDVVNMCLASNVNYLLEKPLKPYALQLAVRAITAKYLDFAKKLLKDQRYAENVASL